jgi:hypothetical protein
MDDIDYLTKINRNRKEEDYMFLTLNKLIIFNLKFY